MRKEVNPDQNLLYKKVLIEWINIRGRFVPQ
jgi:hypothetical protein